MSKRKAKTIILVCTTIFIISSISIFSYLTNRPWYTYSSDTYQVTMDSVIRKLHIDGTNICAKYQVFQCEENYHQKWKLETPKRYDLIDNSLFTYSTLYTYECYKTFTFRENGFDVRLTKAYVITGFSYNNQIIVDIHNSGYRYNETTFIFESSAWELSIEIVESNTPIQIQLPEPTELQFNFDGKADRDINFHNAGDIETVLFHVEIRHF